MKRYFGLFLYGIVETLTMLRMKTKLTISIIGKIFIPIILSTILLSSCSDIIHGSETMMFGFLQFMIGVIKFCAWIFAILLVISLIASIFK